MAYGIAIYSISGAARVYSTSWLLRYHSSYDVNVPAGNESNIYISGFDPSTWGFYLKSAGASSGDVYIYLYSGRIRLVASDNMDTHFQFYVYQA